MPRPGPMTFAPSILVAGLGVPIVLSGDSEATIEAHFAGKGYGALKRDLVELVVATLQPIQDKFYKLMDDERGFNELLSAGAAKASLIANQTVADVRQLVGV